jgi:hypothetical protein
MPKVTYEDIVDLRRWAFIQFRDEATMTAALKKYEAYVARKQGEASA